MKDYFNLFNQIRNSILVVDAMNIVTWLNTWAKNILIEDDIQVGSNFNDIYILDYCENKKYYCHTSRGEKIFYTENKINNSDLKILLLYSRFNFNEDYNKIYCYEKIINLVNDEVFLTDYEGHFKIFNTILEKSENIKFEDVYDKYLWDYFNYEGEEQSEHRKVFREKKPILGRYRLVTYKNNTQRYQYYDTYPIVKDNESIGVVSIGKSEEKLEQLLSETIELKRVSTSKDLDKVESLRNGTTFTFTDILGVSDEIKNSIKEAQTIALLGNNVLIIGETGTGKEMFAQSIHNYINKSEPYVAINCAAIPENLLESILFGSVKGAYTGATDNIGLFEAAGKGTIMLDELQSMPVLMQPKLLRVLQEKKIRKVGDTKMYPINCRVISAVNEDPMELIEKGLLRKDLFYRISSLTLNLSSLKDRKDDIEYLANYFIQKNNKIMNKNINNIEKVLMKLLLEYNWPGNIRELEYVIENLMIKAKSDTDTLKLEFLPSHIKKNLVGNTDIKTRKIVIKNTLLNDALDELEKNMILSSLEENKWNVSQTSYSLGIIRQSLIYRMKRLGIKKEKK